MKLILYTDASLHIPSYSFGYGILIAKEGYNSCITISGSKYFSKGSVEAEVESIKIGIQHIEQNNLMYGCSKLLVRNDCSPAIGRVHKELHEWAAKNNFSLELLHIKGHITNSLKLKYIHQNICHKLAHKAMLDFKNNSNGLPY